MLADQGARLERSPDDCVLGDLRSQQTWVEFVRITRAEAQELARESAQAQEALYRLAHQLSSRDGAWDALREDGTLRGADPETGLPAASGDPVLLHSGELVHVSVDLELAGPELGGLELEGTERALSGSTWRLARIYRSQRRGGTSLGWGWSHSDQHALVRRGQDYWLRGGLGSFVRLRPVSEGRYRSAGGLELRMVGVERRVRDEAGRTYCFRSAPSPFPSEGETERCELLWIEDRGGRRLSYRFDLLGRVREVRDPWGRVVCYRYAPGSGLLREVLLPDGRALRLRHDGRGQLVRSELHVPGRPPQVTRYAYGPSQSPDLAHNPTRLWLPGEAEAERASVEVRYGEAEAELSFDRVVWQRDGESVERFAYGRSQAGWTTQVSRAGRAEERYAFDVRGALLEQVSSHSGQRRVTRYRRDAAGRLLESRDPAGRTLTLSRDAAGRVVGARLRASAPQGRPRPSLVWLIEREPHFGLERAYYGPFVGQIPPPGPAREAGLVLRRELDERGRVVRLVRRGPRGTSVTRLRYDEHGLPVELVRAGARTTLRWRNPPQGPPLSLIHI